MCVSRRWMWVMILLAGLSVATVSAAQPADATSQPAAKAAGAAKVSEQLLQASAGRVRANWVGQVFSWGMLPLWICSVLLVALIFERARALRTERIFDAAMVDEVASLVGADKITEAQKASEASPTVLGRAWGQAFGEFRLGGAPLTEVLTSSTVLAFKPLRKNLQAMATIGVISPSFGLLGTVVGMIIVFSQIELTGGADKGELAGGIGLALFTTAGGLIVAIPAILTSRYFKARLTTLAEKAEEAISRVNYRHVHARARRTSESGPAESTRQGADHEGTD